MTAVRILVMALLLSTAPLAMMPIGANQSEEQTNGQATMSVVPEENTSEYLAIRPDGIDTHGYETSSLDVAAAVKRGSGGVAVAFTMDQLEREEQEAETEAERRRAGERAYFRLENRTAALEQREQRALEQYSDGQIDGQTLVRTLVAVDSEARAIDEAAAGVYQYNEELAEPAVSVEEITQIRTRLRPLHGPVRDRLGDGIEGEDAPLVFVESNGSNVTLAMMDRGRYVREAHHRGARDPDGEDQLGFEGFEERVQELYPWTYDHRGTTNWGTTGGPPYLHHANLWAARIGHAHGSGSTGGLITYIDGSTADVVFEVQRKNPEAVPSKTIETVNSSLRLRIERTRAGGPLGVAVVDTERDILVDAAIEVNGTPIGSTDGNRHWTVAPRGEVTINATHSIGNVTLETNFR